MLLFEARPARSASVSTAAFRPVEANRAPDVAPHLFSGVYAENLANGNVRIHWMTTEASGSQVEYGLTRSYGRATVTDSARVISHTRILTGLMRDALYHYRVGYVDAGGRKVVSEDYAVKTSSGPASHSNVIPETVPSIK